jgi:hypothetical protein
MQRRKFAREFKVETVRLTKKRGRKARADRDRRRASEGAPHRRRPFKKGPLPRRIGRTKGGLNSKLHAACDGKGCCLAKAR